MNMALFIVTMLSVFIAVSDGSECMLSVPSGEHEQLYNLLTIMAFVVIYSFVIYLLIKKVILFISK